MILWKCDCAAALFKLSNGFFSCSVKARFSTLVFKVPHTLAPPLPSLAPCTPFLTVFFRWSPCSLKYQAVFHPRASLLATPPGLGLLFLWEHWYGPLFHAGLSWNIALFGYFLQKSKKGLPSGVSGKEPACQWRRCERHAFSPWVGKIPWRKAWQPTPVVLPRECPGQRSLSGCSPWGRKESDTTDVTAHTTEGQSTPHPLTCSLFLLSFLGSTQHCLACFQGGILIQQLCSSTYNRNWHIFSNK